MSAADDTWRMLAGVIEAARLMPARLRAASGSLPLTVIGGFLGAGKTTLLNRLLAGTHGVRIAVLVNDFGRINIDAALVSSRTADAIALTNGCACCSIAGDLTRALVELAQRDEAPEAIVVEASGVADPRSLAQVALANPAIRLDGVVTVVDAETVFAHSRDPDYGALFGAQVDAADLVILSKADLAGESQAASARAWLEARSPGRPVIGAIDGDVPARVLLDIHSGRALEDLPGGAGHAHPFESRSLESAQALDEATLQALFDRVDGDVVRAKGILWLSSAPARRTIYQRVGRRATFSAGEAWGAETPASRLVVIARRHSPWRDS